MRYAVATLLACMSAGLAAADEASDAEKRAIAAIEKAGGKVWVGRRGDDTLIIEVRLCGPHVMDSHLIQLQKLSRVDGLFLTRASITDAGLVHLKLLPQLEGVTFADTAVTDAGLVHLSALKQLKRVNLEGTEVSDAGVNNLQKALPKLKIYR